MRLGVSTWTFAWSIGMPGYLPERPMQALDLLDRAAKLGVHVVQICENLPLDGLAPGEVAALERWAARLGISIELGTRGIGHDHLQTYLQLASQLRSQILRVVTDTATHHPGEDEIVGTLRELSPDFQRARVALAIENHDRFKAATLARIIERIGSRYVRVCLDTANSLGALEGPEAVLDVLGPLTVNLHIKDVVAQRADHMMGFTIEGRPAGQGQLNIPWLLQRLRQQGRDPNAILELWTPPDVTVAATIARENAWAVSSIAYLRQLVGA